jgi:hypothetical protein
LPWWHTKSGELVEFHVAWNSCHCCRLSLLHQTISKRLNMTQSSLQS